MDVQEIKAFIDAMATSDLAEMEVSKDGWQLRLIRQPCSNADQPEPAHRAAGSVKVAATPARVRPASTVRATANASASDEIRAPLSGILHLQPAPGEPPFITVGATVEAGATVCVVEAMKMVNAVRASRAGTVTAILVASGVEVEAGQPIVRIV